MTSENTPKIATAEIIETEPALSMADMFGTDLGAPAPTPIEQALVTVTRDEIKVKTPEKATFKFRDQLPANELELVKKNAPALAAKMVANPSQIVTFGAPVLEELNATATSMLEAQKKVEVPEAEKIVDNLLREIDGYSEKFSNEKMESITGKAIAFFKKGAYSIKAMAREAQPIADKIDMAEASLKSMEMKLQDNVAHGQILLQNTLASVKNTTRVLGGLEEIMEVVRADFNTVDALLVKAQANADANGLASAEWKGQVMTIQELREVHTDLAGAVSELEKTWFDWRQQFFLGYSNAPATRNLITVSLDMHRRCQVFRTMGLPQAKIALVRWQQAAVAKEAAVQGTRLNEGTNKLIQGSAAATAESVAYVAHAAQAPVISQETVLAIVKSVKDQCQSLVEADKYGRDLRAKNLQALQSGEITIAQDFTDSRRKLVDNAISAANAESITSTQTPNDNGSDIMGLLGK